MKEGSEEGRKEGKQRKRGSQETAVTKTKLWCFKKNLKSRNDGLQSPFWELGKGFTRLTCGLFRVPAGLKKTR